MHFFIQQIFRGKRKQAQLNTSGEAAWVGNVFCFLYFFFLQLW